MYKKLGFGIIGCGHISKKHIEGVIHNYREARLAAISDVNPEKMEKATGYFIDYLNNNRLSEDILRELDSDEEGINSYRDYQMLLNDPDVDIVIIATENGTHPEISIDALNAGKHVIVEKPMALSTADADKMIETAEERDLKLSVCYQNRFNPAIRKLRQAVERDRFGRLVHAVSSVRWNRNKEFYKKNDWYGTLAQDGGTLMNQCIHNIDVLCWMMGGVERVTAEADTFLRDIEVEDAAMAVVRFKNGAIGLVEGTVCIYPRNLEETFNIFGEKGTVRVTGMTLNEIIDWKFADMEKEKAEVIKEINKQTESVHGYGHNLLFKDVIDSIREDRKPLVDGREGKKSIELILGIYKSARTGEPVNFPLGDYATTTGMFLESNY